MTDTESIEHQQLLLTTYRRNLVHLLLQASLRGGEAYMPLDSMNAVRVQREQILAVKGILREKGIFIKDNPDEEEPSSPLLLESSQKEQHRRLREYLGTLSEQCNVLSLADADSHDPNKSAVSLDSVYVHLEIERSIRQREQVVVQENKQQLTLIAALAQHPRLVLLGNPGSGKSTAVNFVARCLALAWINDKQRWLSRLGAEWPHGTLVPIYIVLREFAVWLSGYCPPADSSDTGSMWEFLKMKHGTILADYLRELAHDGHAILLLDGLDEVPADASRQPLSVVRKTIAALGIGLSTGSRIVVTCRVLDYPLRHLGDWSEDTLRPLSPELQEEFIRLWYTELDHLKRLFDDTATSLQVRLTRAIHERAELSRLATNPLLLTLMALIHSYKGPLPETRVRLYQECIEFLLERWRRQADEHPLRTRLELDHKQWNEQSLLEVLYLLGYAAHCRGVHPDGQSGADLSYKLVIEIVQPYFGQHFGQRKSAARAEALAEFVGQASNGVLQVYEQRPGDTPIYRFPHRTFQEYLAGHALINGDLLLEGEQPDDERDLISRALRIADTGVQWREALLLAAGRRIISGERRSVVELARELLASDPTVGTADQGRRTILASDLLREIGSEPPIGIGQRLAPTWDDVRNHLLALIPHTPSASPPPLVLAERNRAALALAHLGDRRPGVCTLPHSLDDLYWCGPFPANTYPIGDGTAPVKLRAFRIARYPVTVWQFRQFWQDPAGYKNKNHWTVQGWVWKQSDPIKTQPYRWDDPDWTAENQPVVGVSWYEAIAFCHWLTMQSQYANWLRSNQEIRLPTEAEWEVASQWDIQTQQMHQWRPPQNELWQNVQEAGIGRTSPVGLFPQGSSPCGAQDMAGNTWEWCMSKYVDYPEKAAQAYTDFPTRQIGPALRGGAYYLQNERSGWDARDKDYPDFQHDLGSFRVVVCSYTPRGSGPRSRSK